MEAALRMSRLQLVLLVSALGGMVTEATSSLQDAASPCSTRTWDDWITCQPVTVSSCTARNTTMSTQCVAPYPSVLYTQKSVATPTVPVAKPSGDGPDIGMAPPSSPTTPATPPAYVPQYLTTHSGVATPHLPSPQHTDEPTAYPSPAVLTPQDSIATPTLPGRPYQTSTTTLPSTSTDASSPDIDQHIAEPANLPGSTAITTPSLIDGTTLTPGGPAVTIHETTYSVAPEGEVTYINGVPARPTQTVSEGDFGDVLSSIFGFGDGETTTTAASSSTLSTSTSTPTSSTTDNSPTSSTPSQSPESNLGYGVPHTTINKLLAFILAALAMI